MPFTTGRKDLCLQHLLTTVNQPQFAGRPGPVHCWCGTKADPSRLRVEVRQRGQFRAFVAEGIPAILHHDPTHLAAESRLRTKHGEEVCFRDRLKKLSWHNPKYWIAHSNKTKVGYTVHTQFDISENSELCEAVTTFCC